MPLFSGCSHIQLFYPAGMLALSVAEHNTNILNGMWRKSSSVLVFIQNKVNTKADTDLKSF